MTYLPFARKWRPQNFDELVGQEHIATILKNAIALNRVHHAYLFTGLRGVGKTSTARILSKALNCEKGPSPEPCNKCSTCEEITRGSSMDVIEIDGASNRGIDEIRNLREAVKFSPSKGRYKIYIIDEVHMLTTEAFNALLKTLEEPPAHVKFIFATTQAYKLPSTILSRCQRFDFRRIPVKDIITKLKAIAKAENLDIEEGVFLYVAKASDGSMRDAVSILDQAASFSEHTIKLKDVLHSLGMIGEETLSKCAGIIIKKDPKAAIELIDEVLNSGKDAKGFLSELMEYFRNLLIIKVVGSAEGIIDLPKEAIEGVKEQSLQLSQGDIFYIISIISHSMAMIKQLLPERIVLELCLIKLTSRDSMVSIEEIVSKLPDITKLAGSQAQASLKPLAPKPGPAPEANIQPTIAQRIQQGMKHIMKADKKEAEPPAEERKNIASFDIARIKNAWPILVKTMAVKRMSISSYLSEGEPDAVKGDTVVVSFPKELNLHREVLEQKANKDFVEETLSQILDSRARIQFVASDRKVSYKEPEKPVVTREELKKTEPVINDALNIFGGKILRSTGSV